MAPHGPGFKSCADVPSGKADSNKARGMRKKAQMDDQIPTIVPGQMSSRQIRRNWARLIQKVYQVDPLLCPVCQGAMKIITFIEDDRVIKKILKHLGLWQTRIHDPPQFNDGHICATGTVLTFDGTYSQLPMIDYWT